MDKVYYKEVHFDLLYPRWIKKFIFLIVRPVVTWAQSLKKSLYKSFKYYWYK